ncbi:MAG: hypothetical protein ABWZ52_04680 [Acidimicrobiales bacterium]
MTNDPARGWRAGRRGPAVAVIIVTVAVVLLGILLIWVLPALLTRRPTVSGAERHEAMHGVRQVLLAGLVGLSAIVGAAYTVRTFRLTQIAQLTGRFQEASRQMGEADTTVRLGGIQAMAQLADEWPEQRQRCVDLLCAYVRNASDGASTEGSTHQDTCRRAIELMSRALKKDAAISWSDCDFDFKHATFLVGDFSGVCFRGPGRFDFEGAMFKDSVKFVGAEFAGADVSFRHARFASGCDVSFARAAFLDGSVDFDHARFEGGSVTFGHEDEGDGEAVEGPPGAARQGATFEGGCKVTFARARLGEGVGIVSFDGATFRGAPAGITFAGARFFESDMGRVSFKEAKFETDVSFDGAIFDRSVSFDGAFLSGRTLSFRGAHFNRKTLTFADAHCAESTFDVDRNELVGTDVGVGIDLTGSQGSPKHPPPEDQPQTVEREES